MREGWVDCSLSDVTQISRERVDPQALDPDSTLVHWSIPALDEIGGPTVDEAKSIGSHKFKISSNSVLISLLNPRIPRFVMAAGGDDVVCSTEFAVITPTDRMRIQYLHVLASSSQVQQQIANLAKGTTKSRERAKAEDLSAIRIALPPLEEQRRIVDVIESVDTYISTLEKRAQTARTARSALLHDLLSNPGPDWEVRNLGSLIDIERGSSPRPIGAFMTQSEDGTNWIKIGDATASRKYIFETSSRITLEGFATPRFVHSGDFILSNSMSYGRPYIMRTSGCIHDGWMLLTNIKENFDEDFLYNLLLSNDMQASFANLAAGSGVRNLKIDNVKAIEVAVPPREIQIAIASLMNDFDELLLAVEGCLERAHATRAALLSDLLSGNHEIPASYDELLGAA